MSDSRYATTTVTTVDYGQGPRLTMVPAVPADTWIFDFTYHQVNAAERLDQIAAAFYGDGRLWWKIADANPEILDWMDIPAGTILRVPNG